MAVPTMSPRWLLGCCVAAVLMAYANAALADDKDFVKQTITYKTVGDTPIRADVYRSTDSRIQPVLVWIHGGALLFGAKEDVPRNLRELCRAGGYVLVSFDYRLAPEVKVPAIVQDIQDAFRWLRTKGPKLLFIDPDRIVVAGGSAGGYLTLMTGCCVEPRPKALVSYFGFGAVDADWLTTSSEHFRTRMPLRTKEEAYAAVGREVLATTQDKPAQQKARVQLFQYLRQNGLWAKEVTGLDPQTERKKLDAYCPIRNVSAAYPPTILIHGTADNDVPVAASKDMAAELARHKVPHELILIPRAGHGLGGGDKQQVADAHERALAFIRKHLQ